MALEWIFQDFTQDGPEQDSPAHILAATLVDVSAPPVPPTPNGIWHHWDFELRPGRYSLSFVSSDSNFDNYACVGPVRYPNQPDPVHPDERYGREFIEFGVKIWISGSGMLFGRGSFTHRFSGPPMISGEIAFEAGAGVVTRIETWRGNPQGGPQNSQALPPGVAEWPDVMWRFEGGVYERAIAMIPGFGSTYPTVSRRTILESEDGILFSVEDGGGTDFNDLVFRLRYLGSSPTQPNPGPKIYVYDYTGDLIERLHAAIFEDLPRPSPDGVVVDTRDRTLRLLNQLHYAGVDLKAQWVRYNAYLPVLAVHPVLRTTRSEPLPDNLRVELTDAERADAQTFRNRFQPHAGAVSYDKAASKNAVDVEKETLFLIVGRIDLWVQTAKEAGNTAEGVLALPKSFALGFWGTALDVAEMSLDAASVEPGLARMLVHCSAGMLGVAAASASPITLLGLIGLVSTAESVRECMRQFRHLEAKLYERLREEARLKMLARGLGQDANADNYRRSGLERLDIFRGDARVDRIDHSPIPKENEGRITFTRPDRPIPSGVADPHGDYQRVDTIDRLLLESEYCDQDGDWSERGFREVEAGDDLESIQVDPNLN